MLPKCEAASRRGGARGSAQAEPECRNQSMQSRLWESRVARASWKCLSRPCRRCVKKSCRKKSARPKSKK